jgi:hypothetical protein
MKNKNGFRPVPAELPGDNEVSPAGETRALRTNCIWSKGRAEYASLAKTFVFLRVFRGEIICVNQR